MKAKKILAAMMATVLAVSPATVFASDVTRTEPGSGDRIVIDGDNVYVDTTVYKVTLPTSTGLSFKLDPQGVFGFFTDPDASSSTPSKNDLTTYAGKIVGDGAHNIKNKSSVPVAVTCDYTLTTDADDIEIVTTGTTVDDDEKQVKLNIVGGTTDAAGKFVAATGSDKFETAIGETSSKVQVVLDEADYVFTQNGDDFSYDPATTGTLETAAAVSISGLVSKNADWSELDGTNAKKITLGCIYSFDGVKDAAPTGLTKTTEGFVTAGADKLEYLSGGNNTLTGTYSKATGGPFSIDPGFTVTSAKVTAMPGNPSMSTALNTTSHYTMSNGLLYFKTAWVSSLANGEWTFELSDGTTTKTLKLTVTA